jgi:hypothetical protein
VKAGRQTDREENIERNREIEEKRDRETELTNNRVTIKITIKLPCIPTS